MPRFRPLSEILANSVTGRNQNVTNQVIENKGRNHVTAKPQLFEGLQCVDGGGVAASTKACFRAAESTDITHEEAGMVQCGACGYSQTVNQKAGRCMHPDLHGGVWVVLGSSIWRRCSGYRAG